LLPVSPSISSPSIKVHYHSFGRFDQNLHYPCQRRRCSHYVFLNEPFSPSPTRDGLRLENYNCCPTRQLGTPIVHVAAQERCSNPVPCSVPTRPESVCTVL